jgi:hypothetical protein
VNKTREIITNTLEKNLLDPQTWQELMSWYDVITQQNYFAMEKFQSKKTD